MHVPLSHLLRWTGWALHSRVHGHWDCGVDVGTSTCTRRTARKIKKRLEGEFEVVDDCGWHTEDKKVKRRGRTGGEVGMWSERGRQRRSQGDQKEI